MERLELAGNHLGVDATRSLAQVLLDCDRLRSLDLRNNRLGGAGMWVLANVFVQERSFSITSLDVSGNKLGDVGARALGLALTDNQGLQVLGTEHNLIGDSGCAALAAGLAANSSLRELRLAGNRFGADGFAALAEAVGSSGVREIDVGDRGRPQEEGELERAGRSALRRALGPRRAPASPEPVVEPQPLPESPLLQRAARSHGLLSTVF